MITSASNPKLRLVHRLLESRRQREKEGLFVAEGEDLVQAADDAGIEPVELLRAGEDVEPELLAKVSTMAHPPRVMGIYRREALPRGVEPLSLALWHVGRSRQPRHDPAQPPTRSAPRSRSRPGCADPTGPKALRASAGAVFRVPLAGFDEPAGKRIALVSHGGPPLAELDPGVPVTLRARSGAGGPARTTSSRPATRRRRSRSRQGAESLNVAIAGAIALYEHRRGGR